MTDKNSINKVNNPHDSLFRKTLINRENAISVLQHYLPNAVLDLIDLESLEISKDSFIEKELSDYYRDHHGPGAAAAF
nr:Rpn family recombination-promoting nuclease/putative transposase [uncultured Desulfobacter sp.]